MSTRLEVKVMGEERIERSQHNGNGFTARPGSPTPALALVAGSYSEAPESAMVRGMTISEAVHDFEHDMARRCVPRTVRDYGEALGVLVDLFPPRWEVRKLTTADCRTALARWNHCSKNTRYWADSVYRSFFRFLYRNDYMARNPMDKLERPRKPDPATLDVVTVSTAEVREMLDATENWSERIALHVLAYLGPRRHAVAMLKLSDYNSRRGMIRFREKGDKTIWKPVPHELANVLNAAIAAGAILEDGYLIPPQGPLSRRGERDDRVIYRLVKKVAARAGVYAHVHAFRGAFADFYADEVLDRGHGSALALQDLMGHASLVTTQGYLRRRQRARGMESVRDLSWRVVPAENTAPVGSPQTAAEVLGVSLGAEQGLREPPLAESSGAMRADSQLEAAELPLDLLRPLLERDWA